MENLQFETRTCEIVVSCFEKEMKDIKASVLGCVKEIEEIKNAVDCCEKDVKEVVSEIHSLKNILVCGIFMAVFYYYFVA
ncbi:unnamed protein product [Arabis nemorensis]|uniref:Uncharacterized protein n=1 Tax=Arabis nemorensis TaxID=586526 RepID=A0A565BSI3_9BRAS|nr:unnamed protein product [Arabis nemorensis]